MLQIQSLERADRDTLTSIVSLHRRTFPGFFLTFMGGGFLSQMYLSYTEHAPSGVLVAREDGRPIGFLAYSADLSGLYKYMIKKRLLPFAWYSLGAFLRRPAVFMRLLRALLKPGESKRTEMYVELASLGVDPAEKKRGVGSALIDALKARVDFTEYAYITLETDAADNEAARRFYEKNGFVQARAYTTREGREMLEYRYRSER